MNNQNIIKCLQIANENLPEDADTFDIHLSVGENAVFIGADNELTDSQKERLEKLGAIRYSYWRY